MTDGNSWPKISVVTPSYNQGRFIEETIRSVLLQGYPDIEYIIIDGGSTDDSIEIIKKYESWLAYWVSEPDRGQSHAINKGIARSTGHELLWLNSDDLVLPNAFSIVAKLFVENTHVRILIGQTQVIDAEGRQIGALRSQFSSWADFATRKCTIRQVATFFDRGLFSELGMINESLDYSMDVDLLLRFTRKFSPEIVESYLAAFRKHDTTKFDHCCVAGYKEADQVRLGHVSGTGLESEYLRWSARNWFKLFLGRGLTISMKEKLACFAQAIKMQPTVLYLPVQLCFALVTMSRAMIGSKTRRRRPPDRGRRRHNKL